MRHIFVWEIEINFCICCKEIKKSRNCQTLMIWEQNYRTVERKDDFSDLDLLFECLKTYYNPNFLHG
jgi:hypothetical protein